MFLWNFACFFPLLFDKPSGKILYFSIPVDCMLSQETYDVPDFGPLSFFPNGRFYSSHCSRSFICIGNLFIKITYVSVIFWCHANNFSFHIYFHLIILLLLSL